MKENSSIILLYIDVPIKYSILIIYTIYPLY